VRASLELYLFLNLSSTHLAIHCHVEAAEPLQGHVIPHLVWIVHHPCVSLSQIRSLAL
jgi:hypothetical protein